MTPCLVMPYQSHNLEGVIMKADTFMILTLLHSEWSKLYGVLTILSAIGSSSDIMVAITFLFSNP